MPLSIIIMKRVFIITGIILILISIIYFTKLFYYIFNSFVLTDFGYGVLVGRIIILLLGITFIYLGLKRNKNY